MFTEESFQIFEIEGLEPRMAAIRSQIQPIFQSLDEKFVEKLMPMVEEELFIHIAQHRRRTTYAPESTWSAMAESKRGYKRLPHFQLAINEEYVAMWLAFIDNPDYEKEIADTLLENLTLLTKLPEDFIFSKDHTVLDTFSLHETDIESAIIRMRDVKKGELMIGRKISRGDKLWQNPEAAEKYMLATYEALVPVYQLAMSVNPTMKETPKV